MDKLVECIEVESAVAPDIVDLVEEQPAVVACLPRPMLWSARVGGGHLLIFPHMTVDRVGFDFD